MSKLEAKTVGTDAFKNCLKLTSLVLMESVTSIGGSAFDGCKILTPFSIPNSLVEVGSLAFFGCENLNEATRSELERRSL
jgi:hypothetical protein